MATLYNRLTDEPRNVRNLGWLLRNAHGIRHISIILNPDGSARMVVPMDAGTHPRIGRYETEWASASILWEWLHRPSFIGCPVYWGNTEDAARREDRAAGVRRVIESTRYEPMPLTSGV